MFGIGGVGGKGIIPAYAGNTLLLILKIWATRDHPRVCGEHWLGSDRWVFVLGSSPRMRGTHVDGVGLLRHLGIIPAYAGNTRIQFSERSHRWDHPRVCGEHRNHRTSRRDTSGSSPRMRGTPVGMPSASRLVGIIPAYAGNTEGGMPLMLARRDHPRVCGEHVYGRYSLPTASGSSPRMRGTRVDACGVSVYGGIIPAYAGNTCYQLGAQHCYGDHPRVCGEHTLSGIAERTGLGSSPRMRGTLKAR